MKRFKKNDQTCVFFFNFLFCVILHFRQLFDMTRRQYRAPVRSSTHDFVSVPDNFEKFFIQKVHYRAIYWQTYYQAIKWYRVNFKASPQLHLLSILSKQIHYVVRILQLSEYFINGIRLQKKFRKNHIEIKVSVYSCFFIQTFWISVSPNGMTGRTHTRININFEDTIGFAFANIFSLILEHKFANKNLLAKNAFPFVQMPHTSCHVFTPQIFFDILLSLNLWIIRKNGKIASHCTL